MARIIPTSLFAAGTLLCGAALANTGINVTTYHYDNGRTGWNPSETTLTVPAVQHGVTGGKTFKMTSFTALDDQVDAQPLIVANQTINGHGVHNVAYVATENNTVYAIDADSGAVIISRNLGPPVPIDALPGGCNNNANNVGIGSTPVIDAAAGRMYVMAYVYTSSVQKYVLHELALTNLADAVAPKLVQGSGRLTNGAHVYFNHAVSRQRAALLLANNNVYAGFASFCDFSADQSRGWVLGWNTGTLAPLAANELTNTLSSAPDNFYLTSVWMSGYGLAASPSGDIYFITGNSDYSGTTLGPNNIAESAVQMSGDLSTVKSVFTPDNAVDLENEDGDFGSGGLMLLPSQTGQTSNFAVGAGKDGNMYLLNADNLNNNTTGASRVLGTYGVGGCWCGQSYYLGVDGKGRVVSSGGNSIGLWVVSGPLHALHNAYFSDGISGSQAPGFFTAVSSNGSVSGTAVIWAVSRPDGSPAENVSLYAFNPNTGAQIFTGVAGTWPNTGGNSNIAPVAANGHVYVASYQGLAIYGLSNQPAASLPSVPPPQIKRIALAPGQHELFGTVKSVDGWNMVVARRDGSLVKVATLGAMQNHAFAQPTVGHGVLVRGKFTATGAMTADAVLHAKDHPGMWQSDR